MSTEAQQKTMADGEDSIGLDDAGEVRLPIVDILTGRGAILGKSGSGKSNSASVIAEELLERGFPLLIVDTDGEYWGLKETYELLHVGADEECDLQVGPEHAEKLAELALEQNVPIILDVSGYLDADEASALVRETTAALFNKEKRLNKPFLLLVEEIHEYIPEGGGLDETGEWLIRVAKRGRKRGLGLCGISQRPANVKKDFLTQADWLVWHRLTWENDTDVVRRVVGKGYDDDVQELADGEALLMADFLDQDLVRVQVRRKETFDAGATPDLGEFERPELKSVGEDLVGELAEITAREERRQDRVAQLEAELERKQSQIEELEEELANARDMSDMAKQFTEAMMSSGGEGGVPTEKVDELVEERNRLESELQDREERIDTLEHRVDELQAAEERLEQYQGLDIEEAEEAVTRLREALGVSADGEAEKWRRKYQQERERREQAQPSGTELEVDILENRAVKQYLSDKREQLRKLSDTKTAMLRYFIVHGPAKARDAYKYAGNSPTSSRRKQYAGELSSAGFIQNVGTETYEYDIQTSVADDLSDGFTDGEREVIADRLNDVIEEAVFETAEDTQLTEP